MTTYSLTYEFGTTGYESLAAYRYANLQRYNVRVIAEPTIDLEPISLVDAYRHLHIDTYGSPPASDHDAWLEEIGIPGARAWCEAYLGVSIAAQTLELATDQFPSSDYIDLPFGPVQSIESVTYLDGAGVDTDFYVDEYQLDTYSDPHRLYLAYGSEWPSEYRSERNALRIRYVTGYSLSTDSPQIQVLPRRIRIGMLLMLDDLFRNRGNTTAIKLDELPIGIRSFLDWDRVRVGFA